jgi:hypothetical protein
VIPFATRAPEYRILKECSAKPRQAEHVRISDSNPYVPQPTKGEAVKKPPFPSNTVDIEVLFHKNHQRLPKPQNHSEPIENTSQPITTFIKSTFKCPRAGYSNKTVAPTMATITQYPPY